MNDNNNNLEVISTEETTVVEAAPAVQNNFGAGLVKGEMILGGIAILGWVVKGGLWLKGKIAAKKAEREYTETDISTEEAAE